MSPDWLLGYIKLLSLNILYFDALITCQEVTIRFRRWRGNGVNKGRIPQTKNTQSFLTVHQRYKASVTLVMVDIVMLNISFCSQQPFSFIYHKHDSVLNRFPIGYIILKMHFNLNWVGVCCFLAKWTWGWHYTVCCSLHGVWLAQCLLSLCYCNWNFRGERWTSSQEEVCYRGKI